MILDRCPSCGLLTPTNARICPFCPPSVRRAQAFGAAIAYVVAFFPALAVLVWICLEVLR